MSADSKDRDGTEPAASDSSSRRSERTSNEISARKAAYMKQYRPAWRERNAEHIAAYRQAYNAEHRDEILAKGRERERQRNERQRVERQRRMQKREAARQWYAENRERHLESQRQYRTNQRATDPEGYRENKRARNKRWRDRHKDEQNEKLRQKYQQDPGAKKAIADRYYANNADKVKAKSRERYAANREAELARQQAWRAKEKRRIEAGLPPRRIHRISEDERKANEEAAGKFFARSYSQDQIAAIKHSPTDPTLIARWNRDTVRLRANAFQRSDPGMREHFHRSVIRRSEVEHEREATRDRQRAAQEAEEARLEAIARQINDRLRTQPRRRRADEHDPSAPHVGPDASRGGMSL